MRGGTNSSARPAALLRRFLYAVLGSLPASYGSLLLVQAWPAYLAPNPYQALPLRLYFACLPAIAVIGCGALWVSALASRPVSAGWLRRFVVFGLIAALLVFLPWEILFLSVPLLIFRSLPHPAPGLGDPFHGALMLTWMLYGPFFVAIHALVGIARGARKSKTAP